MFNLVRFSLVQFGSI